MDEEETALGYMLRKLREEEQPMWDSLWADLKEQDREELKRLKAVDAAREVKKKETKVCRQQGA